ncbi:MAG: hypothetical protein EZS28_023810, partial [Streblomastix strix]
MTKRTSKTRGKEAETIIIVEDEKSAPIQSNSAIDLVSRSVKTIQDQSIFQARLIETVALSLLEEKQRENWQLGIQYLTDFLGINDEDQVKKNIKEESQHKAIVISRRIILALITVAEKEKDNIQLDDLNNSLLNLILFLLQDLYEDKYEFELIDLSSFLPYVAQFKQKLSKQKPTSKGKKITIKADPEINDAKVLLENISQFESEMKQMKDSVVPITSVQIQTPLIATPQIKQQTKIAIKKDKKTAKKEFDEIISLFKQRESSNKPVHVVLIELSELIRVDPDLIDDLLTDQFKKYIILRHQSSDDRFFIAYMNLIRTIIASYHEAFDQKKNSEQLKINKTDKKDKSSKTRDQEGRSKIIIKIRVDHLHRIQQNNSLLLSSNKYVILSLLLLLQTIMKHEKQKNFKDSIDVNTISKIIQRINSFGPILKPYPSLDEYFDISAPSLSQHVQAQSLVELALDVVFEYVLGSSYKSHITNRVGIEIQSSIPQFVILHNRCSIGDEDEIQNNNIDDEEDEEDEDSDEIIVKGKNQGKKKKKSVKEKKKTIKEQNKPKSKRRTNKKGSEDDADEQQEFFIEDEDVANLAKSIRNQKEDQKLNEDEIETRKQLQMRLRVIRAKCALTHGLLADKMKDMKETLKMKDALFGVFGSDGNELGRNFGVIPRPRYFYNYRYEQSQEIFQRYFIKNKQEKINKEINYG